MDDDSCDSGAVMVKIIMVFFLSHSHSGGGGDSRGCGGDTGYKSFGDGNPYGDCGSGKDSGGESRDVGDGGDSSGYGGDTCYEVLLMGARMHIVVVIVVVKVVVVVVVGVTVAAVVLNLGIKRIRNKE